jgi:putative tricarboxylic transport membrane protein
MVAAPPDIGDEERSQLVGMIEQMANSETWKGILEQKGWANTFLAGDEFASYLQSQIEGTTTVLTNLGIAQ